MNGLPAARKIMVIRHGEKPDENGNPPGYTWEGDPDKRSLTSRGWNRAHSLVALFTQRATKD
jgi:broad specificity phosphatase PhoE